MTAWITWAPRLPPSISATLAGWRRTTKVRRAAAACSLNWARITGIRALTRARTLGISSAIRNATTTMASRISTISPVEAPLEESDEEDESSVLIGSVRPGSELSPMSSRSRICTTNPLTLSTTPIETAAAAASPKRWKKRISRASRAAVAGAAIARNWIAYCSMSTGR